MPVETQAERRVVIGLGELLWDLFPEGRRAGGAPANFAFHVNQLGLDGIPASRVGSDALGDELLAFLQEQGLSTQLIQRDNQYPTGTVSVELDAGGHPSYVIHTSVAWDHLDATPPLIAASQRAAAICFGTLAQRSPRSRQTIRQIISHAAAECLVVFDVNLRQQFYSRDVIDESLRMSRIVKLNDDEVSVLGPLLGLATEPTDYARFGHEIIDRYGPRLVCVTRGSSGALLITREEEVRVPGKKVKVVDTVGAGDSFTAALVVTLLQGRELRECGRIANEVGALVASRWGAMPELREEFQHILERKGD